MNDAPLILITSSRQKRGAEFSDGSLSLSASYCQSVASAGGLPWVAPSLPAPGLAPAMVARADGVVLTGGDDLDPALYGQTARHPDLLGPPARGTSELSYARAARERERPTLGVCLGIQTLNVAFGGTLLQFIPEDVPGALRHEENGGETPEHPIRIEPGTLLARIAGAETAIVNSFHHQSVARPAPGFLVSARSPDGIVEAIEREEVPFCLGVQWHPERMPDAALTARLTRAFVDAARG